VPLYRDGKLKILGVADLQRARVLPEVPTLAEAGLPGFRSITWFGLAAPPQTPAALADRINRDVVAILKTDAAGAKLSRSLARSRRHHARGRHEILRRGNRALGPGDQGSRHHAAVEA